MPVSPLLDVLDFASDEDEVFMVLKSLDTAYDADEPRINPLDDEAVSDHDYDLIRQAAERNFPGNPYWDEATGSEYKAGPKIHLQYPMVSLEKCVGSTREEDFAKWIASCRESLGDPKFVMSYKVDGVGVALEYENGTLARGGLRPRNGYDAEDRTASLRMVYGIQPTINPPLTCTIRGELYVSRSDFAEINAGRLARGEKPFENERNVVTGSIRSDDPQIARDRMVRFIAHSVVGVEEGWFATETQRSTFCWKMGFPHVPIYPLEPDNLADMYIAEGRIPGMDYLVDGIVVALGDLESQSQMGTHGGKPTGKPCGKIAWKLPDEEKEGRVYRIAKQVGRTGKMAYIANLIDPLRLEGTNVSRVTLHNLCFVHQNEIVEGTTGIVVKAGKIIPKWVRTTGGKGHYLGDMTCPACGHATQVIAGGKDKYNEFCVNRGCAAQLVRNLVHYLHVLGVKDVGPATVSSLVQHGLVRSPADFYRLNMDSLATAGMSDREGLRALAAIHMVENAAKMKDNIKLSAAIAQAMGARKKVPLWVLFASQGISGAGKDTGVILMSHFGELGKIREASQEQLVAIENVGEITGVAIRSFFRENGEMLDDLLNFVEPEGVRTDGPLRGNTFVMSGSMIPYTEKELEREIVARSGSVASSVTKKMVPDPGGEPHAFLVAGPGSGSKSEKAKSLGVPIITPGDLAVRLGI